MKDLINLIVEDSRQEGFTPRHYAIAACAVVVVILACAMGEAV